MKKTIKANGNLIFPLLMTIILLVVKHYVPTMSSYYTILIPLSYPFRINNDNVISLFGGTSKYGSIYSLIGFYQHAEKNSRAFFMFGAQYGGENATHVIGIAYQHAYYTVVQGIGIAWQISENKDVLQVIGIVYQYAGTNSASLFGIAWQISNGNSEQIIGIAYQYAKTNCNHGTGVTFQIATKKANQLLGLTLYREAKLFTGRGIYLFEHQIAEKISMEI